MQHRLLYIHFRADRLRSFLKSDEQTAIDNICEGQYSLRYPEKLPSHLTEFPLKYMD